MKLNFSSNAGNGGNQHKYDYICDFDKKYPISSSKLTPYINVLLDPDHMPKHIYIYILEFNLFGLLIISYVSHFDHFKHEEKVNL